MKKIKEDFGIMRALSPYLHSSEYKMAKKTLDNLMQRKPQPGHGKTYYAAQVAKSYPHVDAKKLASMKEMSVAGTGGFTGSAAAAGPVAGFDPVLGKMQRRKKLKSFKEYANR